jgi:hypothetical protein
MNVSYWLKAGLIVASAVAVAGCLPKETGLGGVPPNSATSNSLPSIAGSPMPQVMVGSGYSFTPTASDADGDSLSFSISQGSLPSWATFNIVNGSVSGTPGTGDVGTYANIVISVSDGTATVALPSFSITVSMPAQGTGVAMLSWAAPGLFSDGTPLLPTDLIGYRVYHGSSASSLSPYHDIDGALSTSYEAGQLGAGDHCFAVTAVTIANIESPMSAVGCKRI